MAESDAAGPGTPGEPKPRALTREDIARLRAEDEREWDSLTPEERSRREAENAKADLEAFEAAKAAAQPTLEALESAARAARPMLESIERAAAMGDQLAAAVSSGPGPLFDPLSEPVRGIVQSPALYPAILESIEPVGRPLSAEELEAIVAAGVRKGLTEAAPKPAPDCTTPTARASTGSVVGSLPIVRALLATVRHLNTVDPQATEQATVNAAEERKAAPREDNRPDGPVSAERKPARRPRKRTVEGLDVNQWVAAMAAADPSFRHLSQKEAEKMGPFAARTIGTCELWIQMKADLEAEAAEKAKRAKAELEDRLGEDDVGGFRQSSTKHGTGFQRATREDAKHERAVEDFLRSQAGRPTNKRAK